MSTGAGGVAAGFLNDEQLLEALRAGHLLQEGTWNEAGVQQCSYLLTLGRYADYPKSRDSQDEPTHRVFERHRVRSGGRLVVEPGQTVLAYVAERFAMSVDYVAFTVPRGIFFVESLQVGTSYVDPGFAEDFFVPITNLSDRIVAIPVGMPLVRAFFYRLAQPVARRFDRNMSSSLESELEIVGTKESPSLTASQAMLDHELLDDIRSRVPSGNVIAEALTRRITVNEFPDGLPAHVSALVASEIVSATSGQDRSVEAGVSAAAAIAAISRTLLWYRLLFYLFGALIAIAVVPDSVWRFLNGDALPALAKLLIAAFSGALIVGVLVGDLRRTFLKLRPWAFGVKDEKPH